VSSPTRRTFVKAVAGLAAPYAFAQTPKITTSQLGDNTFLLAGAGENVLAHTGSKDGVLLVDGGLAENADALAQAVAALPNSGPVRTLFNTHWHPEQTGSNLKLGCNKISHGPGTGGNSRSFPRSPNPTKPSTTKASSIPESATDISPTRRIPMAISTSTSRSRTSWPWVARSTDKAGP